MPKVPVTCLLPATRSNDSFNISLDHQSQEEATINGSEVKLEYSSQFTRYPFIIMLDGIVSDTNAAGNAVIGFMLMCMF